MVSNVHQKTLHAQMADAAQPNSSGVCGLAGRLLDNRLAANHKSSPCSAGQVICCCMQAAAAWNTAPSPQRSQKCKGFAELLTQKLLALDNIEVAGDARHVRKQLINRINDLCARLENTPSY